MTPLESLFAAIDALRETEDRGTTHWQGCEAVHPRCAVYRAADAARGVLDAVRERECRCSLRTRLVGDGCDICNPELAAEYARQREATDGD